jgi:hypothetical protein
MSNVKKNIRSESSVPLIMTWFLKLLFDQNAIVIDHKFIISNH